jgi:cell division septation protein DedD
LDGETLQSVRTVVDGAKDFWYFMFWNGFRARAAGLDQPVSFTHADTTDSTAPHDSTHRDTTAGVSAQPKDSAKRVGQPTATTAPPSPAVPAASRPANAAAQTFLVSFATLLSEQKAQEMAMSIAVNGIHARVIPAQRAGTMVYRVVLGPYPSREVADQIGKTAQRGFWIYPSEP